MELKKVISSESFKKNIQTAAQGRIVGMQAAKTFESIPAGGEGQIAVVTIWSPRLQRNIGLSLIDRAHWDIGTPVKVQYHDGSRQAGELSALPFA